MICSDGARGARRAGHHADGREAAKDHEGDPEALEAERQEPAGAAEGDGAGAREGLTLSYDPLYLSNYRGSR